MSTENGSFEGVIVAAYTHEEAADEVLNTINHAKKEKHFSFWDAAVVKLDERGRYFLHESKDMSTSKGAGLGAVVGGLIGLVAGPAGVMLGSGLGAALGMFVASSDGGINDARYEEIGHALEAGNSALIIVSSHDYLQAMRDYAGEDETKAAMHKLTMGITEHMAHNQDVAYIITSAGRSVSCHLLRDDALLELLSIPTAAR